MSQSRVAVRGTVGFATNMDVVAITECWAIRLIVNDRIRSGPVFEKPWSEIVGILEREKKTLLTRIRSVTTSRAPRERSVTTENTIIRARNQCDRIPMSVTSTMKIACPETIPRAPVQKAESLISGDGEDFGNR
jgi:hypothetical protein